MIHKHSGASNVFDSWVQICGPSDILHDIFFHHWPFQFSAAGTAHSTQYTPAVKADLDAHVVENICETVRLCKKKSRFLHCQYKKKPGIKTHYLYCWFRLVS